MNIFLKTLTSFMTHFVIVGEFVLPTPLIIDGHIGEEKHFGKSKVESQISKSFLLGDSSCQKPVVIEVVYHWRNVETRAANSLDLICRNFDSPLLFGTKHPRGNTCLSSKKYLSKCMNMLIIN